MNRGKRMLDTPFEEGENSFIILQNNEKQTKSGRNDERSAWYAFVFSTVWIFTTMKLSLHLHAGLSYYLSDSTLI